MKILLIGATGTIGKAVADALAAKHDVILASRSSPVSIDVDDPASLESAFAKIGKVDALVNCAGGIAGVMAPLADLGAVNYESTFRIIKTGVEIVRIGTKHVVDGGSITLTTGALAKHPMKGAPLATLLAAGIEGFIPAAALEMPRGIRINSVSPGWVKETMEKLGMDSSPGMPAASLAKFYLQAVEGTMNGKVLDPLA